MKKRVIVLFMVLLVGLLSGCYREHVPQSGVWYCEEAGIQISMDKGTPSFVTVDGEQRRCGAGHNRGSSWIMMDVETAFGKYSLGEIIFEGDCVYFDEKTMIIRADQTDYVFTRMDRSIAGTEK